MLSQLLHLASVSVQEDGGMKRGVVFGLWVFLVVFITRLRCLRGLSFHAYQVAFEHVLSNRLGLLGVQLTERGDRLSARGATGSVQPNERAQTEQVEAEDS